MLYHCAKGQSSPCSVRAAADAVQAAPTLEDLRESVETLEDVERIARRVFGSEHPRLQFIERHLRNARAALHARETADTPPKDA